MSLVLVWPLVIASAGLCLWGGQRYLAARDRASIAIRQLEVVSADARELSKLRSAAPAEARRNRPPSGLAHSVADVVAKAGLPQSSLQSVSPETETQVAGGALRRQVARITLDQLTLPELGAFLAQWREAEPVWTIASIDITPTRAERGRAKSDHATERPLRAVLEIETLFGNDPTPKEGSR